MIITLLAAISLDGKIAEATTQNSTSWTSKDDVRFFVQKSKEIGALIMGETTYNTIGRPLKDRTIYVLTKDPTHKMHQPGIVYTSGDVKDVLKRIEADGHQKVLIAGGASVYSQFLSQGLVDELFLTVEPYLFGEGISLVSGINRMKLQFLDANKIGPETVVLHYATERKVIEEVVEETEKSPYPYMPEGRTLNYVPVSNPFMTAAKDARTNLAGDPIWPNGAVLVKDGQIVAAAGNGFNRGSHHIHICPRIVHECPSGEGYDLCDLHDPPGHAEQMVIKVAKEQGIDTNGADLYMYGHWWCCEPCWDAMIEAGIKDVYLPEGANELFTREKVHAPYIKPSIKKAMVACPISDIPDGHKESLYTFLDQVGEVCRSIGAEPCLPHRTSAPTEAPDKTPKEIYELTNKRVAETEVLIVEATHASHGVGGEVEIAREFEKPVVLLSKKGTSISRWLRGNPAIVYHIEYETPEEGVRMLKNVLIQL